MVMQCLGPTVYANVNNGPGRRGDYKNDRI